MPADSPSARAPLKAQPDAPNTPGAAPPSRGADASAPDDDDAPAPFAPARAARALAAGLSAWLAAYAQVLFSTRPLTGALFAAATFVVPGHGLAGLVGLAATDLWARLLRRPAAHLAAGYYGFNGLLVGLAVGLFFRPSPSFFVLLVVASLLTVVLASALRNLADRYLGLPVLSLAFIFASWTTLLATRRLAAVEVAVDPVLVGDLGADWLSPPLDLFVRSLGACFFQLSVPSGLLVLAGLLLASRWSVLLAALGFASGAALYVGLGGPVSDLSAHYVGFNFVVAAVAMGGVFLVVSPAALGLAAIAGALSAAISAATLALLAPLYLPILALPAIATILLLLFILVTGPAAPHLTLVRGVPGSPEENLRRHAYRDRRYPDPAVPLVYLPVMGRWRVTQGPDGPHTHQGLWRHAWDLEVDDDRGRTWRDDGLRPEDFYAFGAPVLAPADGEVVRVVAHLDDNPVGEVDTTHSFGNTVVIWHVGHIYSALSHLQQRSVQVRVGDRVTRGQPLARVGSSGRAPVPHLHFQLQASPEVGAPTLFGELLHYVVDAPDGRWHVAHGVPREGDHVAPLAPSDRARVALVLPPGRTLRWRAHAAGRTFDERWVSEIDPVGARRLRVVDGRGVASLYVDDSYATILDHEGPGDTVLAAFALAAARLPWTEDPQVGWRDAPGATAFATPLGRLLADLALPFTPWGAAPTESHIAPDGPRLVLTTRVTSRRAARRLPDRVVVTLEPHVGPVALAAWRDGVEILHAEVVP